MNIQDSESISLFCWNIANPSLKRAGKQGEWLRSRSEDILVLTEAKRSKGCIWLQRYFQAYGYNVVFPKIDGNEYGVMIVSKRLLSKNQFSDNIKFLPSRIVATAISTQRGTLEIIGLYVPSRDSSIEKIKRKKRFLEITTHALQNTPKAGYRIVCGDFNILEPGHFPRYSFFKDWEYGFYSDLIHCQLHDAFRKLHPITHEYSWVGRTGDGYRYDHCFVSENLLTNIKKCFYLHEPREIRLSDHSAIIIELEL